MIWALALALLTGGGDPRISLVELQLERRHEAALMRLEEETRRDPDLARQMGLDYLRGHLLESLGRTDEADEAFAAAMTRTPLIAGYSRYRLAVNQERLGHPEVAAGLVAGLLAHTPPAPLVTPATRLLARALSGGGDCRLIAGRDGWRLPGDERRTLDLASAGCARTDAEPAEARERLLDLLRQEREDGAAIVAAERLAALAGARRAGGETGVLLGLTFYHHRDFDRTAELLGRLFEAADPQIPPELDFAARFALARALFWRGDYPLAAERFGELTGRPPAAETAAEVRYHQARAYELMGDWTAAEEGYRRSHAVDPGGRWAAPALLSALRLLWRRGQEAPALELYAQLGSRRQWRTYHSRIALFLASSALVREQTARVKGWLDDAAVQSASAVEVAYWRGRLAELEDRSTTAVRLYLGILASEPYHPLSRAALARMRSGPLTGPARALALRLAESSTLEDLRDAWLLLGDDHPAGRITRRELEKLLAADARSRAFLEIDFVPPNRWPLWTARLRQPEELLLALGVWQQGAPVVLRHFPVDDPSLGFTGSRLMAAGGLHHRSLYIAEVLNRRVPARLPPQLLPRPFRTLLYPLPYAELIQAEASSRGVDPLLLAALIREESRFDPEAISSASARGLTQFLMPTARRLAPVVGLESISVEDLLRVEPAVALGAAHLAELSQRFAGREPLMIAAYNAGADQAQLWQSYCYSFEPEEYYTKVGFTQTRDYLRKVLSSRAQYAELY